MQLWQLQLNLAHIVTDAETLERQARRDGQHLVGAHLADARESLDSARLELLARQEALDPTPSARPTETRKCSSCGAEFEPTETRRMLCLECFLDGPSEDDAGGD